MSVSQLYHYSCILLCCSVTQLCPTLCDPRDCSRPGFPLLHLLELAQIHVHRVGDIIQPSHPLSSPSPPAFNLSQNQGLFQWVDSFHQVAKLWSFSFSISPSNEYSRMISFRMDWLNLLAVQGTLKSLLQHHSSKASILWCSTLFMAQLSHLYMTTGKTIALTRGIFVGVRLDQLFIESNKMNQRMFLNCHQFSLTLWALAFSEWLPLM